MNKLLKDGGMKCPRCGQIADENQQGSTIFYECYRDGCKQPAFRIAQNGQVINVFNGDDITDMTDEEYDKKMKELGFKTLED